MNSERITPGSLPAEPQLPVFRFGLKHLFWCVTGACLLLAALVTASQTGSMTPLAVLLAVLVVMLHVGGTAIGLRLRQHANARRAWEAARPTNAAGDDGTEIAAVSPVASTMRERPRSPLYGHGRPLRRQRLCVAAGAVVGAFLGVGALMVTVGDRTTVAGIFVGAVSMAVVGAWIAFIGASSWTIFRQGWRDAVNAAAPDERRDT